MFHHSTAFWDTVFVGIGVVVSIWTPLFVTRRNDRINKKAEEEAKVERDKQEAQKLADKERAQAVEFQELKTTVEAIAKQFGDNGGGLRELNNTMRATQIEEVRKSEVIAGIVHEMKGQLTEHIRQHQAAGT